MSNGPTSKGVPGGLAILDDTGRVVATQTAQGAIVADQAALTATQTAAATYSTNEQSMMAALKADAIASRTKLNGLLASLRAAGLIDT